MFDWLRQREAQKVGAKLIGGILRTLLAAAAGGAGLMSDDEIEQLASALAVVAIAGWSVWQKIQAAREQQRLVAEATRKNVSGAGTGTAGAGGGSTPRTITSR